MNKKFREDKTVLAEKISAISLFALALMLTKDNHTHIFNIHLYFWTTSLIIISTLHLVGVYMNMVVLRLVVSWISGIVWTWIAFTSLNTIVYITTLAIGSINIYAFILLTNRVYFDWLEFSE